MKTLTTINPNIDNPNIEIVDQRMRALVAPGALLIQLDSSSQHAEGPLYLPENDSVVWSDVKGDRVLCWHNNEVSILREPAHFQNGNALDTAGRIVACSHRDRAIVRQGDNDQWHTLVDIYQGKRLNSPNDLVVKSDGTIWFTDPPFGINHADEGCGGKQEQPGSFVFRFDPATGDINAVITTMKRPNGLAFSPDERLLYVSDTSAVEDPDMYHEIRAYDIMNGRTATNERIFAIIEPGQPDGFCVDRQGNIFTSSKDSVQIYSPEGTYLGKIPIPEICTNLTFGGENQDRLFITSETSLYTMQLKTMGAVGQ